MKTNNWVNKSLYPFKSNYFKTQHGNMHYVDEGSGETLLFIHGTPTWSFLYRDFIKEFSKTHRCIAIDHLGFGLSEKPIEFDGKPESHAANLTAFIEKLDLKNITLVVHDFGGPIGLGAAIQTHNRIKQIVMFNTWLWETASNPASKKIDKVVNSWLGRFMYLNLNFSPKMLLKQGFSDKKKLTKQLHQQYIKPFPTKQSRYGLLRIGQALVGSSDWYQQQWEQLHLLESKPWLVLWGNKDAFITTEHLSRWKKRLPNAQFHELGCGHFVQEEKAQEAISILEKFLVFD